jgi:hypothetical protein
MNIFIHIIAFTSQRMLKTSVIVALISYILFTVHSYPEDKSTVPTIIDPSLKPDKEKLAKKWPEVKTGPIYEEGRNISHMLATSPNPLSPVYCSDKCKEVYERDMCNPDHCVIPCKYMATGYWNFITKEECYKSMFPNYTKDCWNVGCNIGFELARRWGLEPRIKN